MTLQELRDAVRAQLDLDEEDLPNALVDLYLEEAFQQTIALETRWPFLATTWTVSATADGAAIAMPVDVQAIVTVRDGETAGSLGRVGHQFAEENFGDESGGPLLYSVWGSDLYLWAASDEDKDYTVRGFRIPAAVGSVATATPDCDVRLHNSLVHYACSRAYAQQEDEILAQFYLQTWSALTDSIRGLIMRPQYQGLMQLGSGLRLRGSFPAYRMSF